MGIINLFNQLDQGTYETDCLASYLYHNKRRIIVNCDSEGNINEVKYSDLTFGDDQCNELILEDQIVTSVTLESGTISIFCFVWLKLR